MSTLNLSVMSDEEIEYIGEVRSSNRNVTDRLLERGEGRRSRPGMWLARRMSEYRREKGIESDSEPTEEDIRCQVKLPSREQVQTKRFSEPIKKWVEVEPTDNPPLLPGWNRDNLPEEEHPADWKPPTPPRVDISLMKYKKCFENENAHASPALVPSRKTILKGNSAADEEVVICEDYCIVRTTVGALRRTDTDSDQDSIEVLGEEAQWGSVEDRTRERRRSRSVSSSPGRDTTDFTAHNYGLSRAREASDRRERRREVMSPRGQVRVTRDSQDYRNRRESGHSLSRIRREEWRSSREERRSQGGRHFSRGDRRTEKFSGYSKGHNRRSVDGESVEDERGKWISEGHGESSSRCRYSPSLSSISRRQTYEEYRAQKARMSQMNK